MITKINKKILLLVFLLSALTSSAWAQVIRVATYNLRYDNKSDAEKGDGWQDRYPVIASLIRFHGFDIFGTQECLSHQLQDLQVQLPSYAYEGIGRDDGKQGGEHSAIFYNTEKFRLLDKGNFWLSNTPEKPSKGWDAALPRICTWVKLSAIENGKTLYFFNVHFDHVGVLARKESAKLIMENVKSLAGGHTAILTGDFNVDQHHESYELLARSTMLDDCYEVAGFRYATNGTFNNFNPNSKTNSRIDHIFVSSDIRVDTYGVLTDTYRSPLHDPAEAYQSGNFPKEVKLTDFRARLPSDHFPVVAVIRVP